MLDILVKLIIAVLAIWRISVAIWYEDGPFDLYKSIRKEITRRGMPMLQPEGMTHRPFWYAIWRQFECFWCVSFWVSLPISIIIMLPWYWWTVLIPFALSGAVMLLGGAGRTIWRATTE